MADNDFNEQSELPCPITMIILITIILTSRAPAPWWNTQPLALAGWSHSPLEKLFNRLAWLVFMVIMVIMVALSTGEVAQQGEEIITMINMMGKCDDDYYDDGNNSYVSRR